MISLELGAALEGYDASTLLEHSHHYQQYIQENLLEQVPTDPATVNLSTSYPFYFLCVVIDYPSQFEDAGLPIADEVIDEQANTRRTETERTDQEMKHASHIQHTMPVRIEASTSATFIVDDDWMYLLLNLYFLKTC